MTAKNSARRIQYEFESTPATGDTMPVAKGLLWLRMFLPFSLSHINLWLLEDGDTWSIIDTGVHIDECKDIWTATFESAMDNRPISRVFVTHLHPDHIGCAGWIADRFDAPLWMSRDEYLLARILVADTGRPTPAAGDRFYTGAGFRTEQLNYYHKMFGFFGKFVAPLPEAYRRLKHDDKITIGNYEWKIIVGNGHSPEHACFYNEQLNVLISGDQLLPTISSNVSVFPTEPEANPLADWIESLELLKRSVPEDVLVLPAHGKPFRGAHQRVDELIAEHLQALEKLYIHCSEARRAVDVFPVLFKRKIDDRNLIMATGESISHMNFLVRDGRLSVKRDREGVNWYSQYRG